MPAPKPRPSSEQRITAALWFADRGFGIFPVWSTREDGVCRCPAGSECHSPGKHPITADGFKSATTDPDRIRTFLAAPSAPNYGLVAPDGVFILDIDGEGWQQKLDELEQKHGRLPPTLRTATANGLHIFLRWPEDHPRPLRQLFGWVTRWGSGQHAGYVVGPRSVHPSGAVYAPSPDAVPEIATLPDAWAEAGVTPTSVTVHEAGRFGDVPAGGRHEFLRDRARTLRGAGMTGEVLFDAVMRLNEEHCKPPKAPDEVRRAIGDVETKFAADPVPEVERREYGPTMDAADLLAMEIQPLRMIVPGLLPEGTSLLAAHPKVGKSCLVYQMAVEVSLGGELLGERVEPGSALYLALEDGKRRGQARLQAALAGRTMPRGRLDIRWDAPRIGEGLEDMLSEWLDEHPDAVLVAIDTLGRVRPGGHEKRNAYDVDVDNIGRLQALFRDRSAALVLVHHLNKGHSDDFVTQVSGTYGVSGSVDTIIHVARKRNEQFGTISVTGRDVADGRISVRFDEMTWTAAPESLTEAGFTRTEVYRVVEEIGPAWPKRIADELGLERTNVQHLITALVDDGAVTRTAKGYAVVRQGVSIHSIHSETHAPPSIPPHSLHSFSEKSEGGYNYARAREADDVAVTVKRPDDVTVGCRDYEAHRSSHQRTDDGWTCTQCQEEEL